MLTSADNDLLRRYVNQGDHEAFAELVRRHINKVYSTALRHTRNPHQAEEITQAVFVILAQKAHSLGPNVILSGWLYQTARLTAVTYIRSAIRRAHREKEAHMENIPNETESHPWPELAPHLDEGLAGLNERDRHALVLRFFDGRSLKEVGELLGSNESAAKVRVHRAVEKLRRFFSRRGVVVPTAVLIATISANSVQAAPVLLAKTASITAGASGIAGNVSILALVEGTMQAMIWAKAKAALLWSAAAVAIAKITFRELELKETLYLSGGLILCLFLPMMLSLFDPSNPTIRKSSLKIVWAGQLLLAVAGLLLLVSETAAHSAVPAAALGYIGLAVLLYRKLRSPRTPITLAVS